jgi:DUF1680 family protein
VSITNTSASPHVTLRSVGLTEMQFTGDFLGRLVTHCRDTMVPVMGKLMQETERVKYIGNFAVAAGLEEGRHRGPRWNDGDFFKWFEGAAMSLREPDPALDAQLDTLVTLVGQAQRDDGYLHTDVQIRQRAGDTTAREFGNPMDFEMYNMGHLISAAIVHRRITGKDNLFRLARRSADFLDRAFADPKPEQARHGICPAHLMALVELYRETREQRYLDLAVRLLNMRDLVVGGDDDNQDRIPFRKQTTAHGHAVRATYLYASAADLYAETGDDTLLAPLQAIWKDLVDRKLYITGGCGALFDGASPDGAEDQLAITRVHQAFGRAYQLPHTTAHNETCAAIGNLMWNWRMLQITGEPRFAEILEQAFYNSVLVGVSLDGESYFYTNTLRQLDEMPCELRWNRRRQKFISCFCCPPNVVRTVAQVGHYAWLKSDHGLNAILYGSGMLETTLVDGTAVRIETTTRYPFDGKIVLTLHRAGNKSWPLALRIPSWALGARVRVNNESSKSATQGTFHVIERSWQDGDVVELHLPMRPRWVAAHPLVEEARNQLAAMFGPIVYALESPDLPASVRLQDVRLKPDTAPKPVSCDDLIPGAIALEATFVQTNDTADTSLYREWSPAGATTFTARLVPYFAWGNRGPSEMSVWLPTA